MGQAHLIYDVGQVGPVTTTDCDEDVRLAATNQRAKRHACRSYRVKRRCPGGQPCLACWSSMAKRHAARTLRTRGGHPRNIRCSLFMNATMFVTYGRAGPPHRCNLRSSASAKPESCPVQSRKNHPCSSSPDGGRRPGLRRMIRAPALPCQVLDHRRPEPGSIGLTGHARLPTWARLR